MSEASDTVEAAYLHVIATGRDHIAAGLLLKLELQAMTSMQLPRPNHQEVLAMYRAHLVESRRLIREFLVTALEGGDEA